LASAAGRQRTWAATGLDLFEALRELRRQLDPLGIRLGCNGVRRDTWASGMQRDMGGGTTVYLLIPGQPGRPAQVDTLGPTALSQIGTVAEQQAHTPPGQQHDQDAEAEHSGVQSIDHQYTSALGGTSTLLIMSH
jgi:hypothetical protein